MSDPNMPSLEPAAVPAASTSDLSPETITPTPATTAAAPARAKRRVPIFAVVLIAVLVPVVILASAGIWAVFNRQHITDQIAVWNYEGSPSVAKYIDESTFTEHALFVFEASEPRIAPDSEFNSICGDNEGGDGVLGCYTRKDKRITLFEIADKRLAGLQEAVASHEMLHAAWDRLGKAERAHLAKLLEVEVERLADDDQFQDQLDAYDFDSDNERFDELHALIGTEVPDVADQLEKYYAKYFEDRAELVALYTTANDVLVEIAAAVEKLNDEIEALDKEIGADSEVYKSGWEVLEADSEAFEARNNAYFYTSQRAYDIDRDALVARGDALDVLYDEIGVKIDSFNALLDELTELDAEAAELFSSINIESRR